MLFVVKKARLYCYCNHKSFYMAVSQNGTMEIPKLYHPEYGDPKGNP